MPAIPWSALLAADEAIKRANEAARRKADTRPLIEHLPPIIRIANPSDGAHVQTNTVTLDYAVRSPSGQAVDRLDLLINMGLLDERLCQLPARNLYEPKLPDSTDAPRS